MFDAKTVFILGAGASWHYGYPTGEGLVSAVREKASLASAKFRQMRDNGIGPEFIPEFVKRKEFDPNNPEVIKKHWLTAIDECEELAARLEAVSPLVIDFFLGQNRHLKEIGRMCIAWVLLEREYVQLRFGGNENRRYEGNPNADRASQDNWYRFLIHKLVTGCKDGESLLNNDVVFVTFNYDTSLEYELKRGLKHLDQFYKSTDEFLNDGRILHVYGKIRQDAFAEPNSDIKWDIFGRVSKLESKPEPGPPQLWRDAKILFDAAFQASKGIEIISPDKSGAEAVTPIIDKARKDIEAAKCIYILGYGFDRYNNDLLLLPKILSDIRSKGKYTLFTNYENRGVVNKNACRVLFGTVLNNFLAAEMVVDGSEKAGWLCEKSIRNVYDAMAYDFDSPEEWVQKVS